MISYFHSFSSFSPIAVYRVFVLDIGSYAKKNNCIKVKGTLISHFIFPISGDLFCQLLFFGQNIFPCLVYFCEILKFSLFRLWFCHCQRICFNFLMPSFSFNFKFCHPKTLISTRVASAVIYVIPILNLAVALAYISLYRCHFFPSFHFLCLCPIEEN